VTVALIGVAGVMLGVIVGAALKELQRRHVERVDVRASARALEPELVRYATDLACAAEASLTEFSEPTDPQHSHERALASWEKHRGALSKGLPAEQWYRLAAAWGAAATLAPDYVLAQLHAIDHPEPLPALPALLNQFVPRDPSWAAWSPATSRAVNLATSVTQMHQGVVLLAELAGRPNRQAIREPAGLA
jgi:hypothetical protein